MTSATKHQHRQQMRALRNHIPPEERLRGSSAVTDRVLSLDWVQQAETIFTYVSYRSEVSTHRLIHHWLEAGKTVLVPATGPTGQMQAQAIRAWSELQATSSGILEPKLSQPYSGEIDLCITPGLAFTLAGDRLGYGRGNYDQFLSQQPSLITLALAFELQLVDHLPCEAHDHRVNYIATPERLIDTSCYR